MNRYLAGLGFALVLGMAAPASASTAAADDSTVESAVAVQHARVSLPGLRDEAAMVLVGTALIGLGAAVRRSA
jgi:hypothetical protein